jgi:predicted TIM-barrel fold metal-dependent hydrolase
MQRHLLVSSDCHAAARPDDYRPYLERRHLAAYEAWLPSMQRGDVSERAKHAQRYVAQTVSEHFDHASVRDGGEQGYWDFSRRLRELDADGVAAEVIFPNFGNVPFDAFPSGEGDPALRLVGARTYNRWLADRVRDSGGRQAGIALVTIDDALTAAAEVRSAAEAGLRGVLLPIGMARLPLYNDARYEPLWRACEETGLPVHTHAAPSANPVPGHGGDAIALHEALWHTQRPLWCLIFGGVLDRHPGLRVVITEAGVEWIPELLARMQIAYAGRPTQKFTEHLEFQPLARGLRPSELWRRQCWAGASFMPRAETELRHQIGVDRLMWGSDYPHIEGTWPHTRERLRDAFGGVPEAEVARMLGTNAIECYGFDRARLEAVAARIGPPRGEIGRAA